MNSRIAALAFVGHSINPRQAPEALELLRSFVDLKKLNWEEIILLANASLVTPALWAGLRQKGLCNGVPEDCRSYLEEIHQQNTSRNSYLLRQLLEIVKVLNRHDIVPVALKGAAYLLTGTFPDPGTRIMVDLDLLVSKKYFTTSINSLQAIGYSTEEKLIEEFNHHHHYAPLSRAGEFASVELHHTLMARSAAKIFPTDTAWRQVEVKEINGACFHVLTPTYRILHNVLHSEIVDRNYNKGIISLRALTDLVYTQYYFEQQIDWPIIKAILAQHNKQEVLYSYLFFAHRYLGMSLPISIRSSLSSFIHQQRCQSKIRWLWLMRIDYHIQRFSAHHICKLYGCPDTFLALTIGRLRYIVRMVRKCFRGIQGGMVPR